MNLPERKGVVSGKAGPLTLLGPELKVGQKAPDFTAVAQDMKPVRFLDFKGTRVLVSVPSLETPVCDMEGKRFNKEAANLGDVKVLLISVDTPLAQKRWSSSCGADKITTLSDFREREFGRAYGAFIKESWLLARAVFVVDAADKITYVEFCPELGKEPDYDKILGHLKQTVKA